MDNLDTFKLTLKNGVAKIVTRKCLHDNYLNNERNKSIVASYEQVTFTYHVRDNQTGELLKPFTGADPYSYSTEADAHIFANDCQYIADGENPEGDPYRFESVRVEHRLSE